MKSFTESELALYGIPDAAEGYRPWRGSIEAEIDRLIAILDEFDGDADMEPSLGAPEPHYGRAGWGLSDAVPLTSQEDWPEGLPVDGEAELVNEDGGDINDDPQDANTSEDCEVDEPTIFSPNGSRLFGGGSGI